MRDVRGEAALAGERGFEAPQQRVGRIRQRLQFVDAIDARHFGEHQGRERTAEAQGIAALVVE